MSDTESPRETPEADPDTAAAGPESPSAAQAGTEPSAAYRVLARKYRPQTFADLVGQEALVRTLTNALKSGRLAQAFILTGVRGIGKTTTARIVARALNCVGPDGTGGPTAEPCGVCDPCRAIAEDRHVDVVEMDAASRTGVDDIRDLIEGARYRPVAARFKVYIIDEVHMLSKNAFNALLKTLEEPPEHVKFIFATTEVRKVPVTVLSRCQRFDLRRLDQERLAAHLTDIAGRERAEFEPEAVALIARAADGSVRDGLSLLDQAIALAGGGAAGRPVTAAEVRDMLGLADRTQTLDLLDAVMRGETAAALSLVGAMYRAGADPVMILQDLLDLTHWLTRLKIVEGAVEGVAVSEAERSRAEAMAEGLPMPALGRAWQMLLKGLGEAQMAPSPQTALEMLLVRLAYVAELPAPAEIVKALNSPATAPAPSPAPTGSAAETSAAPAVSPSQPRGSGGPRAALAVEPAAPPPQPAMPEPPQPAGRAPKPRSFADAVALFAERREAMLHAHLVNSVHLVRFEPGRIEMRPTDSAPADLANSFGRQLAAWTGERWVVTVSGEPGEPTLGEQAEAAEQARKDEAAQDPLVRAVLETFPGASIEAVRDREILGDVQPAGDAPPGDDEEM